MSPTPDSSGVGRRLGVDVGGTKSLAVLIDDNGSVLDEARVPTPRGVGSGPAVIEAVAELASAVIRRSGPVDSVGVGMPGLVTPDGVLRAAPNLDEVAEVDVAGELSAVLGRMVSVDNDATCALLAEWTIGAGRGVDDLLLVTLGTGIGGGVVMGGRVLRGAHGFAGEFGHIMVDPNGPECPCGRRGCWERYASGSGLNELGRGLQLGGSGLADGPAILSAARRGLPEALEVVERFASWVGIGLAGLTNSFDPSTIILGGGLVTDADVFLSRIEDHVRLNLYSSTARPTPRILCAELGERAGAIGAALLVLPPGR